MHSSSREKPWRRASSSYREEPSLLPLNCQKSSHFTLKRIFPSSVVVSQSGHLVRKCSAPPKLFVMDATNADGLAEDDGGEEDEEKEGQSEAKPQMNRRSKSLMAKMGPRNVVKSEAIRLEVIQEVSKEESK